MLIVHLPHEGPAVELGPGDYDTKKIIATATRIGAMVTDSGRKWYLVVLNGTTRYLSEEGIYQHLHPTTEPAID